MGAGHRVFHPLQRVEGSPALSPRPKNHRRARVGDWVRVTRCEGEPAEVLPVVELRSAWDQCVHRFLEWRDENLLVLRTHDVGDVPYLEHECVLAQRPLVEALSVLPGVTDVDAHDIEYVDFCAPLETLGILAGLVGDGESDSFRIEVRAFENNKPRWRLRGIMGDPFTLGEMLKKRVAA